jgi:SAM-dependent methyltransferase
MNKDAFNTLRGAEGTWWDEGRRLAVSKALQKTTDLQSHTARILDIGAGYGSMHAFLSTYGVVSGFEPEAEPSKIAKDRGYATFYTSIDEAVEAGDTYDLLGAFDVLEHVKEDYEFTKKLSALTADNGYLVATVPAFQWLWSEHDVSHYHFRRHTTASMRKLLESAGYEVVYVRYWNVLLFPVAMVMRLCGTAGEGGLHPHPFMELVLRSVVRLESFLAPLITFFRLPGLSVVIVGCKKP